MNLAVELSMQVLSLTLELIEDLAGYCFAFRKAIEKKNTHVPEYLRDWDYKDRKEHGSPDAFYREASENIRYAAEVSGLDPVADLNKALDLQQRFRTLKAFRDKYQEWYQGYKHGQRCIPVFSAPGGSPTGCAASWNPVGCFAHSSRVD